MRLPSRLHNLAPRGAATPGKIFSGAPLTYGEITATREGLMATTGPTPAAGPTSTLIDALAAAGERRTAAATNSAGWALADDFAATMAVLRADYTGVDEADSPLHAINEVFGLDDTDGALLWLAAAVDLD